MTLDTKILKSLQICFPDADIDLINESYKHAGHMGDNGTGETHYCVEIVSNVFDGKTRLASQRLVMNALKELMGEGGIHALSIKIKKHKKII